MTETSGSGSGSIGICEPPLGLVKDKNHPSEQTDQLDLSLSLPYPSLCPPTLSTYAKMGPSTVAHFMSISLGSVYNACFANFYELADDGQEKFGGHNGRNTCCARKVLSAANADFLMSRRRQTFFNGLIKRPKIILNLPKILLHKKVVNIFMPALICNVNHCGQVRSRRRSRGRGWGWGRVWVRVRVCKLLGRCLSALRRC